MSVVGIDVGNLNAVIAAARQGGIEVLTNEYTYRLTPYVDVPDLLGYRWPKYLYLVNPGAEMG